MKFTLNEIRRQWYNLPGTVAYLICVLLLAIAGFYVMAWLQDNEEGDQHGRVIKLEVTNVYLQELLKPVR